MVPRMFLRADQAAVEEREAGAAHHQHQGGGDQHPGVVAGGLRAGDGSGLRGKLLLECGDASGVRCGRDDGGRGEYLRRELLTRRKEAGGPGFRGRVPT